MQSIVDSERLLKVSIIIVNHNGLQHLKKCLPSVFHQDYPNFEVLLVDNASTDGSQEFIEQEYPAVRLISVQVNAGYAAGNNIGFQAASGDYLVCLNPDTKVAPGWLDPLVEVLRSNSQAGLATPKILMLDDPGKINTCGNQITLTGLTYCRGLGEPATHYPDLGIVPAVSGAAFMIRRTVLEKIGGFDEDYFMYYEDTDLSLRAMLAGYDCYYVPQSVVHHQYTFRFNALKAYYQERNRYISTLKIFHWGTILALLPSLLMTEVLVWGYALTHGPEHIKSKIRAYLWVLRNRKQIRQARQTVQSLRQLHDHQLLQRLSCRLSFAGAVRPALGVVLEALVNPLLIVFGKISLLIVSW